MQLLLGTNTIDYGGTIYQIESRIPHQYYDINTKFNDIGLVKTANTIYFNDYIQPLRLPDVDPMIEAPPRYFFAGWGRLVSYLNLHESTSNVNKIS